MSADLRRLRRSLHAEPEVGLELPATQRMLLDELDGLGLEISTGRAATSVVAVLRGSRPGPSVLLRADMDGLPILEQADLPWRSTNGAMHACGHDLHMSGLVGAARLLVARRAELAGNVIFAFQPGEEGHGGGRIMIEEGLLDAAGDRPVACFAVHVMPERPAGTFRTRSGTIMAGMSALHIAVDGLGGHASAPHVLRDPVPVIAEITLALQSTITRRFDVSDPVVLSVTQLESASKALNVVPDTARLAASVRTLSSNSLQRLRTEIPRLAQGISQAHGCTSTTRLDDLYPATVNHPTETTFAVDQIAALLGPDRISVMPDPLMASEDFSYLLNELPGAFLLLDAGVATTSTNPGQTLHSARVLFDDAVLADQAATLAWLATERLAAATGG